MKGNNCEVAGLGSGLGVRVGLRARVSTRAKIVGSVRSGVALWV